MQTEEVQSSCILKDMAEGRSPGEKGEEGHSRSNGGKAWQPETVKYFGSDINTGGSTAMTAILSIPTLLF